MNWRSYKREGKRGEKKSGKIKSVGRQEEEEPGEEEEDEWSEGEEVAEEQEVDFSRQSTSQVEVTKSEHR